jgi:hypothetical protein
VPAGAVGPLASAAVTPPPPEPMPGIFDVSDVGTGALFLGGVLTSFSLHELGHLGVNLLYNNKPTIGPVYYAGFIPFFVVDSQLIRADPDGHAYLKHDGTPFPSGKHGYYVINTAGLQVQNISSEIILSTAPRLRYQHAPFRKGMLLLNIGLSIVYATSSMFRFEDPHGDLYGAMQHSTYPREFTASVVLVPAVADFLRYLYPDNAWLPWISRGAKGLFLGMAVKF